jgi:hydrogenase maturation protein HypF
VFQNARLTAVTASDLTAAGLEPLVHRRVPANDGGLSIGQAAIASY